VKYLLKEEFTVIVVLVLIWNSIGILPAQAIVLPNSSTLRTTQNTTNMIAGRSTAPKNRISGGKSGSSCTLNEPLIALVPGQGDKADSTSTEEAVPTFWFYIPHLSTSNLTAELILVDSGNTTHSRKSITLSTVPGIVSVEPSKPLDKFGQDYRWVFKIICDQQDPASDINVGSTIQRVRKDSVSKSNSWHEKLTSLLKKVCLGSTGAELEKQKLLQSIGLEKIYKEPIHNCKPVLGHQTK